ncbi:MAG TPA: hypothetical protein VNQ48_04010 [Microbacteriaceae bacterium]|nr:hypothetical protein [Microbacteriaceae bacterium]
MATLLPRIQVTPTPELVAAIEAEQRRRPGASRSEIVVGLALRGLAGADGEAQTRREARRRALAETRGLLDYPADYLTGLRRDWDRGDNA